MQVLVLGNNGMLGVAVCHQLRQAGFDVIAKGRDSFDAKNLDLRGLIPEGCEAVINACGMINRRLKQAPEDFLLVNSLFPRHLADLCEARNVRLIHVSTDCVFKGDQGPYDETSSATADEFYGQSKLWGEPRNAMVIRTSIIGPELVNHYSLLCWFLQQENDVNGFFNHHWNGLTTLELARALGNILTKSLWQPGVFHLFGEDLSKFTLLKMIASAFQSTTPIKAIDDTVARDTRLRSVYDLQQQLQILPMTAQLERLCEVSNHHGHWIAGK